MFTLRCTRKLLERLRIPPDTRSDVQADNALGDWYANLVRVGRDQLVIAMSERSFLTLLMPARGIRESIASEIPRILAVVLRELEVPDAVIEREIAAMHPLTYGRTASRSVVANLNERARMVEHLWRHGRAPMDIMMSMARLPITTASATGEAYPSRAARRLLGLDPRPAPPATVIRLHVSLEGLSPPIWRRLVVPEAITLPQLHRALQVAMGWKDRHLHEFELGGIRYGLSDEDDLDTTLRDESGVRLADLVRDGRVERFKYVYDFGDDWTHDVLVEAIEPNAQGVRGVACLDGANHCPPEDVGGPDGYLELIQALRDPAHEQHRDVTAWMGKQAFDPAEFDLKLVNALLRVEFGD